MKKRILMVSLVVAFCFSFSVGVWAENTIEKPNERIIVNEEENSITFVYPDSNASLLSEVSNLPAFNDVPEDAWYQMFVSHLTQIGVIDGTSPNMFSPNENVTRAELAKMIAYAADVDLSSYSGSTAFTDVPNDAWYAPSVQWANENSIIMGKTATNFCPSDNITREEVITMVYRLALFQESDVIGRGHYELDEASMENLAADEVEELTSVLDGNLFNDVDEVSNWAKEAVDTLNTAGVLAGDENWNVNPQYSILRSEAAKILSAYILFDKTPTLYFGDSAPIEYLGTSEQDSFNGEEILAELDIDEGTNLHGVGSFGVDSALVDSNDSDDFSLSWAGTTHDGITGAAFSMINSDRSYIYNKMCEVVSSTDYVRTGLRTIRYFSVATDDIENDNGYEGHFYDASTGNSFTGHSTNTAYKNFNKHYYNALVGYRSNKYYSYKELGMACHYVEDLLAPHHAKLVTVGEPLRGDHSGYESWVNSKFSSFGIPTMEQASYRFMYDNSTKTIADGFSARAKALYSDCDNHSFSATQELIHRAERGITGFLNAYYYKAGGVNS